MFNLKNLFILCLGIAMPFLLLILISGLRSPKVKNSKANLANEEAIRKILENIERDDFSDFKTYSNF